jgi:hypothetical protein
MFRPLQYVVGEQRFFTGSNGNEHAASVTDPSPGELKLFPFGKLQNDI